MEYYNYIKALHLIFVITWFAGLFYIPRLFIYQIEAGEKAEPEKSILTAQLKLMTRRLWFIITWPSAILASTFGLTLLVINPAWLHTNWMLLKLLFVLFLFLYHYKCHLIFRQLQRDVVKWSSKRMRIWNEISTLLLFAIIFLVIVRDAVGWVFGIIGLLLLALLLIMGIKLYRYLRSKNPEL